MFSNFNDGWVTNEDGVAVRFKNLYLIEYMDKKRLLLVPYDMGKMPDGRGYYRVSLHRPIFWEPPCQHEAITGAQIKQIKVNVRCAIEAMPRRPCRPVPVVEFHDTFDEKIN